MMIGHSKNLFKLMVCLFCLSLITGCSDEVDDSSADLPSIGGGGDSPVEDTPVGEIEQSGFWVNVQSDQIDLYIDNSESFDSNCFIDKDEAGFVDMKCYLDIMEGDLYVHDLEVQYNAPPGLCNYVYISPAWHWNEPVGYGPSTVEIWLDASGDTPIVDSCHATHGNIPNDGAPPLPISIAAPTCANHNELTDTTNPDGPTCVYNRSTSGYSDCCLGSYTKIVHSDDGTAVSTTSSVESWGGDPSSCLSPFIGNGWEHFNAANFPVPYIQHVPRDSSDNPTGLNNSLNLTSNASTSKVTYSTWANHYEGVTTALPLLGPHYHTEFYGGGGESNKPYSVDPITDLSGNSVRMSGYDNGAWTFSCLDSALEVKQRIKLYVREWNTLADFVLYQTSGGATYNPDVTGSEGIGCDYDDVFGGSCNDLADFGDILNGPGNYNTSPTPTYSEILPFFPNVIYE